MIDLYESPTCADRPVRVCGDGRLFVGEFWLPRERPPLNALTPIGVVSGLGARVERYRVNGTRDVIRRVTMNGDTYWDVAPEDAVGGGQREEGGGER